jgi:hypothetical protein
VDYRRRRSTPGGEAFAYLFAGDERPPGIPTPFSLSCLLCETEFSIFYKKKFEFSNRNLLRIWLFDAY